MKKKPKDCPLFLHKASGNWAKKVLNKTVYFGKDLDAALKRWADEKDYRLAGRPVPKDDPSPTLQELGNLFVDSCKRKSQQTGKPSGRSISDYVTTISRIIAIRGKDSRPEWWTPSDFAEIHQALYDPIERTTAIRGGVKGRDILQRSPVTVGNDIRRIRIFLKWCADNKHIAHVPTYGSEFSPQSIADQRKARSLRGRRDLPSKELRLILDECNVNLKPLVLLAINAGIGNLDLALIPKDQFSSNVLKQEFADLPRHKTGSDRKFWLWPETRKAIADYIKARPTPIGMKNSDFLFLTKFGQCWVRDVDGGHQDAITKAFEKARNAAGLKRWTFYDLRRTFATVAAETQDVGAIKMCMGHAVPKNDMTALYTQHISDERVKAVCQHVRKWLFGKIK